MIESSQTLCLWTWSQKSFKNASLPKKRLQKVELLGITIKEIHILNKEAVATIGHSAIATMGKKNILKRVKYYAHSSKKLTILAASRSFNLLLGEQGVDLALILFKGFVRIMLSLIFYAQLYGLTSMEK